MATAFCAWNSFIQVCATLCFLMPPQGYYLTQQCPSTTPGTPGWWPHQVAGLLIWLTGWLLNLHSDGILRNLRTSPADTGQGNALMSATDQTTLCFAATYIPVTGFAL